MAYSDRLDIVSVVGETHALIGNSLGAEVPAFLVVRTEWLLPLQQGPERPLIQDDEMVELTRSAYFELIGNVATVQDILLGPTGEELDLRLAATGLTGTQLAMKVAGFRRELAGTLEQSQRPRRRRWFRRAAKWANIILGSLTTVPIVGPVVEPIKEFKDVVETQIEQESQPVA